MTIRDPPVPSVFVTFVIFCANDFSSLPRHLDRRKAKVIFEQKTAKSHRL
jgi:hypothetical protein